MISLEHRAIRGENAAPLPRIVVVMSGEPAQAVPLLHQVEAKAMRHRGDRRIGAIGGRKESQKGPEQHAHHKEQRDRMEESVTPERATRSAWHEPSARRARSGEGPLLSGAGIFDEIDEERIIATWQDAPPGSIRSSPDDQLSEPNLDLRDFSQVLLPGKKARLQVVLEDLQPLLTR